MAGAARHNGWSFQFCKIDDNDDNIVKIEICLSGPDKASSLYVSKLSPVHIPTNVCKPLGQVWTTVSH